MTDFFSSTPIKIDIEFKDSQGAFAQAIAARRLSTDPDSPVYAGKYMYMGTKDGIDLFKNTMTRKYLVVS